MGWVGVRLNPHPLKAEGAAPNGRLVCNKAGLAALGVAGGFAEVGDEEADAVSELDDFAFALDVEFDFVVAGGGVVYGFLEADKRLHDLFGEGETDPDADEEGDRGNDGERPLGGRTQAASFAMIVLDAVPTLCFELAGHARGLLGRCFGDQR